ncbi:probable endochitinase [Dendroctonus ponderosae]|uniref:probable endochitinase n=1 Tax=Dendroctonus ponderosae TaxID=77166 RepID=UPI002035CDAE|nr:probable endochitinase [Dendroctonus ponderosae]
MGPESKLSLFKKANGRSRMINTNMPNNATFIPRPRCKLRSLLLICLVVILLVQISNSERAARRRLRRPLKSSSQRVAVSKDQEVAPSVSKFRRTRPGHKKPSDNDVSASTTKKDKDGYKVVCYYTNWSQYRVKVGKFTPEDILPDLCTHVIFAFGWLKKGKLSSFESNDETKDGKVGLYERIQKLKKGNPNLKTLLAIAE